MDSASAFVYYSKPRPPASAVACVFCSQIFNASSNPHLLLECGHRICSICFGQKGSGTITCSNCGLVSSSEGLKYDQDTLNTLKHQQGGAPVADTNVFEVKLCKLDEETDVSAATPVFCENCHALRNSFSLTVVESERKLWTCEFCSCPNSLALNTPDPPIGESTTYILDPVSVEAPTQQYHPTDDDSTTIFCIDTSGSMQSVDRLSTPISIHGGHPVSQVSRIDCVKIAIEAQINQMLLDTPSKHIGFVEFQTFVTMHGDGRYQEVVAVNQNYFDDYQPVLDYVAGKHDHYVGRTIKESKNDLLARLNSLTAPGAQELLGPGLLLGVGLAIQGKPGSKVVICTDGITYTKPGFYEAVGLLAQQRGVSISVISFTSGDCNLAGLSILADLTEGNVWRVDTKYIENCVGAHADPSRPDDFKFILSERTVATDVQATVTLHKALKFKNERPNEVQAGGSQLRRKIGNASQYSSFTFEYAVKNEAELVISEVDMEGVTQLPFQLVMEYRNLRGQRCLKGYSKVLKVTSDQEQAEQEVNFDVLHRNYQVQNARLAAEGQFTAFKEQDSAYQQLLSKHAINEEQKQEFQEVAQQMAVLKTAVERQEASEGRSGRVESEVVQNSRKAHMQDDLSLAINQFKKSKKQA